MRICGFSRVKSAILWNLDSYLVEVLFEIGMLRARMPRYSAGFPSVGLLIGLIFTARAS
jgi:hypothetical protein